VKSHEVIERAVEARGPKHVAAELGVSLSLVYKWAEPIEKSGTVNPLDRAAQLMNATDAAVLVQWLCEQAGGYFVKNPVASPLDSMRVLDETQRMLKEFSDLLTAVSTAVADGVFSKAEAVGIRREWEDVKRTAESLVVACERSAR
jgi:hypothetical protein